MSPRITHIDPEETIRKLKAKVDRLEKALAEKTAQQALDKMAENARELGLDYEPAQQKESMRPYRQLQDNGSKYFGESWDKAEQPAQQEPVAWICYGSNNKHDIDFFEDDIADLAVGTKLYTQAQRTWVGLTDDEIYSVLENLQVMHHRPPTTDSRVIFALAIEAKLRSKNEDRD